ncbi:YtxH domain-containing protein [Spirosoma sp. HMF4905]|uniref:YtxH domain-containing protein n=1 Tax=Spirosoma arboris TaxID=2682092 RepID=A0A7K1SFX4_9BACT|nr:YtxH domain-containing protein [Spirosoma arboris]MVM32466.1 YtxH domain-containing protein [Spirosoma arboris]
MKTLLTGIAAGLAIGYLTAPRSGKETRSQLTDAANQRTKGLKEQWDKTVSQAKQAIDEVKTKSSLFKSEPNLFTDMEAGKLDKYMTEEDIARRTVKEEYPTNVDESLRPVEQL